MTAMKTFFTSHERKKIMVVKKKVARHPGSESIARYMMNTHPSCEAAWYTVKMLVAAGVTEVFDENTMDKRPICIYYNN